MTDPQRIKSYYEGTVEAVYRAIAGAALHLGMFEGDEPRQVATRRTNAYLAARLAVGPDSTLCDLGSGYGDAARFLAARFGCRVVALNLVHAQNVEALALNRQAGLDSRVRLVEADFGRPPLPAASADVVWSQEALLHAPDRGQVLVEAARLLRPGGPLIFTDILQTGPMEPDEARQIYERVQIDSLESFDSYRAHLQAAGLVVEEVVDLSQHVAPSYQDHVERLHEQYDSLAAAVGPEYLDYTIRAMERWVRAAEAGKLGWGMFLARKP
ncbi:MAG: SAM-dependent methyltransferase [Anaerolineae bacterium]